MSIKPSRPGHIALIKLMGALHSGPHTTDELVDLSGLSAWTVRSYILTGRRQKEIYRAGWQPDDRGRMTLATYTLGRKKDVPRLVYVRDSAAAMRAWRLRNKTNKVLHLLAA